MREQRKKCPFRLWGLGRCIGERCAIYDPCGECAILNAAHEAFMTADTLIQQYGNARMEGEQKDAATE